MPPRAFPHRPFSSLKKLVRHGHVRLASESNKTPVAPPTVDPSLSEEEAFQMAMEGVRPLGWSQAAPLRLPGPIEMKDSDEETEALAQLQALIGGAGAIDPFISGEGVSGAPSRKGQQYLPRLKNGEFSVQAHLDLHGMNPREARPVLETFLRGAVRRGQTCVRVVHGRGKHSRAEPAVLKSQVTRWLASRRLSRFVVAFASARWTDGGSGAVYVLLHR